MSILIKLRTPIIGPTIILAPISGSFTSTVTSFHFSTYSSRTNIGHIYGNFPKFEPILPNFRGINSVKKGLEEIKNVVRGRSTLLCFLYFVVRTKKDAMSPQNFLAKHVISKNLHFHN